MTAIIRTPSFIGGGGKNGYPTADVSNIQVLPGAMNNMLRWTDPDDTILDNAALSEWECTIVVRKAGSVPKDIKDGVTIVENGVRNQYQDVWLEDTSNLISGTVYYYRFFTRSKLGVISNSSPTVKVTANEVSPIFSENSWERISEIAQIGTAQSYWSVGDTKTLQLSGVLNKTIELRIIGFNADYLADDSGKAGITLGVSKIYDASNFSSDFDKRVKNVVSQESGVFSDYINSFPEGLRDQIKRIKKYALGGTITPGLSDPGYGAKEEIIECRVFVPTTRDMGYGALYDLEFPTAYKEKCVPYPVYTDNESRIMRNESGTAITYVLLDCPYESGSGTGGGTSNYANVFVEARGTLWKQQYESSFGIFLCFCL